MVSETSAQRAEALLRQSVVSVPTTARSATRGPTGGGNRILFAGGTPGDLFSPWGLRPKLRDSQLRAFWPTENWMAAAIGSVAIRNASMSWTISGDPETAAASQEMVANANFGAGWEEFAIQTALDLYTQDSGAFVELIRAEDSELAPVVGLAHLDAARCWPTGVPETPVLYEGVDGVHRLMPSYTVVQLLESPSPKTFQNLGYFWKLQYSAVTRILRAAQILKNVGVYKEEKTGGRYNRGVHLVSGFTPKEIEDALDQASGTADAQGLTRFLRVPIISALNPEADIKHILLEIAGLPDGFDEEQTIKDYIAILATALGVDYQDLAPLPGGNLGTGAQSEILHMKARGRGAALWQKLITRLMNFHGVLPRNVTFEFTEPDVEAERQTAEVDKLQVDKITGLLESGIINEVEARQMAADDGLIPQEFLAQDLTPDQTIEGDENPEAPEGVVLKDEGGGKRARLAGPEEREQWELDVEESVEAALRRTGGRLARSLREHAADPLVV